MRKPRQADFWRDAWARLGIQEADEQFDMAWAEAMDQARAGDWGWVDELVQRVRDDDVIQCAPSPALWPALDVFFGAPPNRRKGKKPRVDKTAAEAIRHYFWHMTTKPQTIVDANGRVLRTEPPMTAARAREWIARDYHLSPEAIRDVVERRKTYRNDP